MRIAWFCLLLAVGASIGCWEWSPYCCKPAAAPPATPVPAAKPVAPPPPVTAEQVTPQNAREKAEALRAEMDREAQ
jgi:hypothetical protein